MRTPNSLSLPGSATTLILAKSTALNRSTGPQDQARLRRFPPFPVWDSQDVYWPSRPHARCTMTDTFMLGKLAESFRDGQRLR
ncbi:hypothetical protein ARMSODRAFT_530056 [Armillaria solidipes]|uniref:Uncharacterized protein n=1 Tax=Armillaria solidipes TaxID=1076256 RepID=A0A2H3BIF8_9AGAR|nr:hypothetical protein ARMSODRAFT_530056 [Armillaria solidipes]